MARIQSPFRSKRPSRHRDTGRRSHRCQVASARVCHAQVRQAASSDSCNNAAIHQGHKVLYYEAYALIEAIADAALDGTRKTLLTTLSTVPLLIIDDLGMRKLPHTAAEDLLEIIMRRYERASTLLTSNRPVDD